MKIFATILGYLGMAFLAFSFQCKREKALFVCQMLSGLFFVFHYGLLGDYTGMAMDGVCFLRALMMASGKRVLMSRGMMCGILATILLLCVVTWEGIFSLFPTIALFVSTVFLYSANGDKIRRAQLFCTSPSWMVYNIHVFSVPGILCEALDMGSVLLYEYRAWRKSRATRELSKKKEW